VGLEPDLVELPDERYTGPGVVAEWDRRNHVMFPTGGFQVQGRLTFFDDAFGSDRDFRRLVWSVAGYEALGDTNRVLAGRILHQAAFDDVPFSAQSIMNGNRNLRGYSNGRYRDDQLVMIEAEYRWMFHRRWGLVGFAGAGWVADRPAGMSLGETLPSAGLGVRFRIIETYRINARIDYGWGKHDQAVYFAVGEHF
jgi:outer membrane translocation and assembly module TamA